MRKLLLVFAMAPLWLSLIAIQIIDPQGKVAEFSYDTLKSQELQSFTTLRMKNGHEVSDNWKGIALLPWLANNGYTDWHSLNSISTDGYEVRMHRVDLDAMPAYLALYQDDAALPEYDLRIIYPKTRENLWLRNLKSINLELFKSIPYPGQLYIWESKLEQLHIDNGLVTITTLMSNAFHQAKGTVVFVDSENNCLALEYPAQLKDAELLIDSGTKLRLGNIKLKGKMQLGDIVYLQCGPYAYIQKESVNNLKAIGTALQWDWERLTPYTVTGSTTRMETREFPDDKAENIWLELKETK
jgi:hypothetical protein